MRLGLCLLLGVSSPAFAADPDMLTTVGVGVEASAFGMLRTLSELTRTEVEMAPTIGLSFRARKPLDEYFTIGAAVGLSRWHMSDTEGGNSLLEVSARPGARYTIQDGLEVYGVIPIGPTVSYLPEKTWGDRDSSLGWHAGLLAGLRATPTESLRLFAEAGYLRRAARHQVFGFQFRARTHEPVLRIGVETVLP